MVDTESAIKLVQELKINKLLPKYNDQLLQEICAKIQKDYIQLATQLS